MNEGVKDLATINDGDVVILPAFGASLEEMRYLDEKNVQVVDTTCPWVSKVWNTVDKHTKVIFFFFALVVFTKTIVYIFLSFVVIIIVTVFCLSFRFSIFFVALITCDVN